MSCLNIKVINERIFRGFLHRYDDNENDDDDNDDSDNDDNYDVDDGDIDDDDDADFLQNKTKTILALVESLARQVGKNMNTI
jgi:hypothetical protein